MSQLGFQIEKVSRESVDVFEASSCVKHTDCIKTSDFSSNSFFVTKDGGLLSFQAHPKVILSSFDWGIPRIIG